ncbi:MAG: hypothetical protein VX529_04435 [Pseudomonadota bacterium]|nr:hypothetical protein [Pseudomonadota bacterium]
MALRQRSMTGPLLWGAAILVTLVIVIVVRFDLSGNLEIDACLDAGGRWDRSTSICDFTPPQEETSRGTRAVSVRAALQG